MSVTVSLSPEQREQLITVLSKWIREATTIDVEQRRGVREVEPDLTSRRYEPTDGITCTLTINGGAVDIPYERKPE